MRRILLISLTLSLLLAAAGCGASRADTPEEDAGLTQTEQTQSAAGLLADAAPEQSALMLYYYDGEKVTIRTLYDPALEQTLLDEINALPAQTVENADLSQWAAPCYGLWIADGEGNNLFAAWWNGQWLAQDGSVYQVDADFPGWWEQLAWEDEDDSLSVLNFPNAGLLSQENDLFLAPVEEDYGISDLPLGIYMTVLSMEDGVLTVLIDNQSGYTISYSEYYALQMERDGQWYALPTVGEAAFIDIAYELPDLEQVEVTCDLSIFGELEAGHYRLAKDDMTAEFWLDESGALTEGTSAETGSEAAADADVAMTVDADHLFNVQVTLYNNTDADAWYNWDFTLWKQEGDSWTQVPYLEQVYICGMKDPLPAGKYAELTLDFTSLFGALEDGRYQLSMEEEGWSAEFEINQET